MDKTKKDQIKGKAKTVKSKAKAIKARMKGAAKAIALAFAIASLAGCMTPEQASRSTSAGYGDIEPTVKVYLENASSNTVAVTITTTIGDGAIASADSSGSNETQTQTPNFDISPKTDLHYNDAIKNATDASKGVLEKLTDASAQAVLKMMASKQTGTLQVEQNDGSTVTVECKDGQCSICPDYEVKK